jgi:hypothetical protein
LLLPPEASCITLPEIYFYARARFNAQFIIKGIIKYVKNDDWITIRQLFENVEVGRVTWQFQHEEKENPDIKE